MRRIALGLITVVAVIGLVGCGATDNADSGAASSSTSVASGGLPDLPLTDVATGESVQLSSLVPSSTPVLAWFWAPF